MALIINVLTLKVIVKSFATCSVLSVFPWLSGHSDIKDSELINKIVLYLMPLTGGITPPLSLVLDTFSSYAVSMSKLILGGTSGK